MLKAHWKERTYDLYKQTYRLYLLPAFGQKEIATITRDDVKKFAYGLLTQGKSYASVRFILAPLSVLFRQAIEDGHLSVHPATRILRHGHTAPRKEADFLTEEEAGRLLRACREHFPASYP
jgi:integrase